MSLYKKVVLFILFSISISVGICAFIINESNKKDLDASLATELLAIVQTGVHLIDGDLHSLISTKANQNLETQNEFQSIQKALIEIKKSNFLEAQNRSPIYTLRPAQDFKDSKELEFVVMTDKNDQSVIYPGGRCPLKPHLAKALSGQSAATSIYKDSEGAWISAAVPFYDSNNNLSGILQTDRSVNEYTLRTKEKDLIIFIIALFTVIFSAILSAIFSRSFVKRISSILTITKKIEAGDLKHRIQDKGSDELHRLAEGINQMADVLNRVKEIRDENELSIVKRQAELKEEMVKAEKANQDKSDFLANMSHEIRTPMNAINGMAELLEQSPLDNNQKDMVSTIRYSGDLLLQLLNNILDISKIEASELRLERIDFDFQKCVKNGIALLKNLAQQKNIDLILEIDSQVPRFLKGDQTRFTQILNNLVSNAIKFTERGSVTVKLENRPLLKEIHEITLMVSDTGIGIPDSFKKNLFLEFSQADASTTRKYGGTGLGLAICAKLLQAMKGTITVESSLGKGSVFTIQIPMELGDSIKVQQEISYKKKLDHGRNYPHNILLVEDNPFNQKLVTKIFEQYGYSCDIASNGLEAMEAIESNNNSYSIIFMDMQMPIMNGTTTASKICKNYPDHHPPIIAMTANAFEEDKQNCLDAGMVGFVSKPIQVNPILNLLKKYSSKD